jgi:CheY-like chemotaxis protein
LEKIRKVSSLVTPRNGQRFDVCICDVEMPGESCRALKIDLRLMTIVMDGLTAVRQIRKEEAEGTLASTFVIALSESLVQHL